jgi:hypothetical protein
MDRTLRRLAVLSLAAGLAARAAASDVVLQTWHPWQLDSVLVAWALTQARSPAPAFESITRGAPIAAERGIDTPDSPYRRTGQRTAFEEAVRLNHVNHPCVHRLRDAVRVVELAAWRKPEFPAVEEFEARVLKVIPARPMRGGLDAALAEVDRYCREGRP